MDLQYEFSSADPFAASVSVLLECGREPGCVLMHQIDAVTGLNLKVPWPKQLSAGGLRSLRLCNGHSISLYFFNMASLSWAICTGNSLSCESNLSNCDQNGWTVSAASSRHGTLSVTHIWLGYEAWAMPLSLQTWMCWYNLHSMSWWFEESWKICLILVLHLSGTLRGKEPPLWCWLAQQNIQEKEKKSKESRGQPRKERAREEIQRRTRSAHEDYKRHRFLKKPLSRTQRQTSCTDRHILQVPRSHAKHLCTPTAATRSYSSSK